MLIVFKVLVLWFIIGIILNLICKWGIQQLFHIFTATLRNVLEQVVSEIERLGSINFGWCSGD